MQFPKQLLVRLHSWHFWVQASFFGPKLQVANPRRAVPVRAPRLAVEARGTQAGRQIQVSGSCRTLQLCSARAELFQTSGPSLARGEQQTLGCQTFSTLSYPVCLRLFQWVAVGEESPLKKWVEGSGAAPQPAQAWHFCVSVGAGGGGE